MHSEIRLVIYILLLYVASIIFGNIMKAITPSLYVILSWQALIPDYWNEMSTNAGKIKFMPLVKGNTVKKH